MEALGKSVLLIRPEETAKCSVFHAMQVLRSALQKVVVAGLPSVARSVIHADEKTGTSFKILVEGADFQQVQCEACANLGCHHPLSPNTHPPN